MKWNVVSAEVVDQPRERHNGMSKHIGARSFGFDDPVDQHAHFCLGQINFIPMPLVRLKGNANEIQSA